uniref:Gem-associated protein 6 Sm-like domain-containing protein n=1 Tax=Junco hyemalis TaxID=40217 RepID=A0A8C5I8S3_JUNHY
MNDWQKKSPLDWQTYVNKLVKVVAAEKHEYEGWVLTVDPVSATLLQCEPEPSVVCSVVFSFHKLATVIKKNLFWR